MHIPDPHHCYYCSISFYIDPEDEPEPEVDLSAFLERQRATLDQEQNSIASSSTLSQDLNGRPKNILSSSSSPLVGTETQDDEIDHELEQMMNATHVNSKTSDAAHSRKNNKQVLEWDQSMEEMQREKKAAEAMRGTI